MVVDDRMRQLIRQWLAQELPLVAPANPEHIHVDKLLGADWRNSDLIPSAIALFLEVVTLVVAQGGPVKPILIIPLRTLGKKLTLRVPTMTSLDAQVDDMEPPSLYLISWNELPEAVVCEEYCRPLDLFRDWFDEHVYVYYREHRYGVAFTNKWEYARAIYVEYYPGGKRLQ